MSIEPPYLMFLGDVADQLAAKTAQGIVHWRPDACIGQTRLAGCKADLGIDEMTIADAASKGSKTLVIGVANSGGFMPAHWEAQVLEALELGMDVASGLHVKLTDMPTIRQKANECGRQLFDVRHPAREFKTGTGIKRPGKRLLAVGTDCSVGKMYTTLALERAMHARGMKAAFRATGQTGILITGDGVSIDAVVADFISGAVEWLSPDNDADHWDLIEGQGSLFHPAFAGVSMGLLHGAQADALVMCHEPTRTHMRGLKHQPLPDIERCMDMNLEAAQLTNPAARFVGVAVNTSNVDRSERQACLDELAARTNLPALDPFIDDLSPILDRLP